MKSSLRKLRGFALQRQEHRAVRRGHAAAPIAHHDELLLAANDMLAMRKCYDNLLAVAAATANCAYEFSEALRDMGTCFLKSITSNEDGANSKVLLMLGKAQFELQKLANSYREHVLQTITTPSESLLKELQTVEDMKRQCDEKRGLYEFMLTTHRGKGRSKYAKGESTSLDQLKQAQEDYQEEATMFLFRLKSLKQGQFRSLLTQAARHHAAQLNLFRKGLNSLEAVEPHVKLAAEQQHIDYQFSGLEEDYGVEDENDDGYDDSHDEALSFDYGRNEEVPEVDRVSRNSMEEFLDRNQGDFSFPSERQRSGSQSAPLLADKKLEPSEGIKELRRSATRKLSTYVLPTPSEIQSSSLACPGNTIGLLESRVSQHSYPTNVKDLRENKLPSPTRLSNAQSVLKESNTNTVETVTPTSGDLTLPVHHSKNSFGTKKANRQAFSGPLTSKAWSVENASVVSAMPMHSSTPQPTLPQRVSPSASPPPVSSPKIKELHELPRPPVNSSAKATLLPSLITHSAPLVPRGPDFSRTRQTTTNVSQTASPLPAPPGAMARSFSIPSRSPRTSSTPDGKVTEVQDIGPRMSISSPPLTQICLVKRLLVSADSESISQASKT